MLTNIIPSTKLKIVTVHKIQDTSCWRYYYWRWIRNLEPRKMNINFWYGSVLHAGFQTLIMKGLKQALINMAKESRTRRSRNVLTNEDLQECDLQMRLIQTIIKAAAVQPFIKHLKMEWAEKQFKTELVKGIVFCSTLDGCGSYKNEKVMYEIKTAKSVTNDYFTALGLDQQIHGYGVQMKRSKLPFIAKVAYCVFRKSSKWIKKGQSPDAFVEEIQQDIKERPEWYFIVDSQQRTFPYLLTMGSNTLQDTEADIIQTTKDLQHKYNVPEKTLLNHEYWPKNCKHCLNYGACQFLPLCRNIRKNELYMRFYQQRELRYDEEQSELKV